MATEDLTPPEGWRVRRELGWWHIEKTTGNSGGYLLPPEATADEVSDLLDLIDAYQKKQDIARHEDVEAAITAAAREIGIVKIGASCEFCGAPASRVAGDNHILCERCAP
jgi:hypothetical protein